MERTRTNPTGDRTPHQFYFSPKSVATLGNHVSLAQKEQCRPQCDTSLLALIWLTVVLAHYPSENLSAESMASLSISVQRSVSSPFAATARHLGSLETIQVMLPVRRMLSFVTLEDISNHVQRAIPQLAANFDLPVPRDYGGSTELRPGLCGAEQGSSVSGGSESSLPASVLIREIVVGWFAFNGASYVQNRSDAVLVQLTNVPEGGKDVTILVDAQCSSRMMRDPLWTRYAVSK